MKAFVIIFVLTMLAIGFAAGKAADSVVTKAISQHQQELAGI